MKIEIRRGARALSIVGMPKLAAVQVAVQLGASPVWKQAPRVVLAAVGAEDDQTPAAVAQAIEEALLASLPAGTC